MRGVDLMLIVSVNIGLVTLINYVYDRQPPIPPNTVKMTHADCMKEYGKYPCWVEPERKLSYRECMDKYGEYPCQK